MGLWAFFANLLADVPSLQRIDCSPSKQKRDQQGRHRSIGRAKSNVLKNIKTLYQPPILVRMVKDQLVKDVIDHLSVGSCQSLVVSGAGGRRATDSLPL